MARRAAAAICAFHRGRNHQMGDAADHVECKDMISMVASHAMLAGQASARDSIGAGRDFTSSAFGSVYLPFRSGPRISEMRLKPLPRWRAGSMHAGQVDGRFQLPADYPIAGCVALLAVAALSSIRHQYRLDDRHEKPVPAAARLYRIQPILR